jgi:Cof subfamily protein (haloacid dehalogenase superfamily)
MKIELLFSDLDGTLVEHASDITNETLNSVKKLRDNGVDTLLVTGRHPDMTKSIYSQINNNRPVIGCNGGIIKNIETNEVLYANQLSEDKIRKAIEIAKKFGIDWIIYEQNNILYDKMPPKSYKMPYRNMELPENLRANFIKLENEEDAFQDNYAYLKILLLFDKNMDAIADAAKLLNEMEDVVILRSATAYLDVMPAGSTKGTALKRYIELKGYKREEIAAIGDAENDLDMIDFAGFGIAMGNSVKQVRDIADHITTSQPHGFSDAANLIIEKNKNV